MARHRRSGCRRALVALAPEGPALVALVPEGPALGTAEALKPAP